jgi:hypothetical protein
MVISEALNLPPNTVKQKRVSTWEHGRKPPQSLLGAVMDYSSIVPIPDEETIASADFADLVRRIEEDDGTDTALRLGQQERLVAAWTKRIERRTGPVTNAEAQVTLAMMRYLKMTDLR